MTIIRMTAKLIIFVLSCCAFAYLVPACSTGKHLTAYADLWRPDKARPAMTDENLSKFLSQLKPHPGNAEAHYQLGCWYLDRSRYQEAIQEFRKAIHIRPDYAEAYNGLGVSYDWQGEYSAASDAYRIAVKLNPHLATAYNNLGHSYILQGKNDEAIKALNQAIAMGCDNKRTHNNLGLAYAFSGHLELAMREFESTGNKGLAHSLAAQFYYQKGQFEKAKKHYEEAVALDPDSSSSQQGLETSTLLAKFDAVLSQLKQAVNVVVPGEPTPTQTSEEAPKNFANIGVELSNGNGTIGMARNVGQYLKERGFNIVRLTNADSFKYSKTTIMHKPESREATRELAGHLPEIPTVKEVKRLERPNIQMKIVLGKDLVPHQVTFKEEKQ